MIKKVLLTILIVFIGIIIAVVTSIDTIVATGIEEGGNFAFGVETKISSVNLGLTSGSCELNNFSIANPEGFKSECFFKLEKGVLDIAPKALWDDELVIESLIIAGVELNLEQIDKKGNFSELTNHINKIDFGESSESEQKIRIKKVALSDVKVSTVLNILGKERLNKTFQLDNFTIDNLGGNNGESMGKITSDLVKKIIAKAIASDKNELNINLNLNEKIDQLKEDASEKIETEVKDKLNKLGKSITGGK